MENGEPLLAHLVWQAAHEGGHAAGRHVLTGTAWAPRPQSDRLTRLRIGPSLRTMPIEVTVDKENDLVHRVVTGTNTTDEVLESLQAVLSHPDYRPGMRSLTDLREMKHLADANDIKRLARFLVGQANRLKPAKVAVVVSSQASYGMMRMLQVYCSELPIAIEIFDDLDEAERWLGLPVSAER